MSPADSTVSDGSDANTILEKNITWGNLIDVSDEKYGLNQISLYPSALNLDALIVYLRLDKPRRL